MDKQPKTLRQNVALALAALGVVYGDIGTSPLYALRECFSSHYGLPVTPDNVLGLLSMILWSLIFVVSVKYVGVVLRADNRGEGGILSLMALAQRKSGPVPVAWIVVVGMFGAGLLIGDGMLTPAISVLSALEGINVATPVFARYVEPLTLLILILIFVFQSQGTRKIGITFGPIICLWFVVLAILGIRGIMMNPVVLTAINPLHAFEFLASHGWLSMGILGSIFLVVTGGEALYADMGHFGRTPIRMAWFTLALPALATNYFGQGALILTTPSATENPFYFLAPQWALVPLVVLAVMASIIASQAVITGVFSLTSQAMQLGFCPRMKVVHTSSTEIGQIYVPFMNWFLMAGTLWLVMTFQTSSRLAAAYGIAVSLTMVLTTLLIWVVSIRYWKWNPYFAMFVMLLFFTVDFAFFSANFMKVEHGGWFPLGLGLAMYILMSTWRMGRRILMARMRLKTIPLEDFIKMIETHPPTRVKGTAVFMFGDQKGTPPALYYNMKHNKILHENILLLTIVNEEVPTVPSYERVQIEQLMSCMIRVTAHYGFMEKPNIEDIVMQCALDLKRPMRVQDMTFYLGRENLIPLTSGGMPLWREKIFAFLSHNSQRASIFFQLPADQTIEVGIQVEI